MEYWNTVKEWVEFGADVCIWFITIYTFYKTFICNKLSILNLSSRRSIRDGDYQKITLLNKKMSPIVVTEVKMIIDDRYLFRMYNGEPVVIQGNETQVISTGNYGFLEPDISIYGSDKVIFEITLESKKRIYLKMYKRARWYSKRKLKKLEEVQQITWKCGNKIMPRDAKYVIWVKNKDGMEPIFVFETGLMTGDILGYNGLSEDVVKSKEKLEAYLHEWLDKYKVVFSVQSIDNIFGSIVDE